MTTQIILALLGYFVFSAAVGAMSPPSELQAKGLYGWMYRFLQILAANANRIAEAKFGQLAVIPPDRAATFEKSTQVSVSQSVSETKENL